MYTLPGRSLADIPVLETPRLVLRASRLEDFDAQFAMWQDETYVRFIGNRKRSSGEVWQTIQRNIGAWALYGFGYLVAEDRKTGDFVGECGFMISRRGEISPHLPLEPEAGWGIAPAYWGKGIVYEAMAAMFIAQAYGIDLSFGQQLLVVITALMASRPLTRAAAMKTDNPIWLA